MSYNVLADVCDAQATSVYVRKESSTAFHFDFCMKM